MTVRELNEDQKSELKVNYYSNKNNDSISYGEIVAINSLVTDEEIEREYEGVFFVEDDFMCSEVEND